MASTVLDCFPKLLRDNASERADGGLKLIQHLSREVQENGESKEFNHTLNRLIRGLGSPKSSSRKGFYATLTVFLSLNPDTKVDKIFSIMDQELKAAASCSKSECGDIHNGRILACGALIRSKVLKTCSTDEQKKVLECLIHCGKQKSYLNFESMSFVVDFLKQLDSDLFTPIWPLLEKEIFKPFSEQTLDKFYVLLVILDKFPEILNKKTIKKHFGTSSIINEDTIQDISKILIDVPRVICYKHPVYEIFCQKLIASNNIELIKNFWTVIDQCFIKPSKTDKHLGVELFFTLLENIANKIEYIINTVNKKESMENIKNKKEYIEKVIDEKTMFKSIIPSLLSTSFLKYMIKRLQNNPNKKDEIAGGFRKALTQLVTVLDKRIDSELLASVNDKKINLLEFDKEKESKLRISILEKLILYPGDLMIEKLTGTKVLQMISNKLNANGVKELSKLYKEIAANIKFKEKSNSEQEIWKNEERIYAIQLLSVKLMSHPEIIPDHEWRLEQLKFLFNLGLCEVSDVDTELLPHFKETFYRALDHKLPKLNDLRSVLSFLIIHINNTVFQNSEVTLRRPLDEEATEAWKKMLKLNEKLENDSKSKEKICAVFHTMNLHMGLQLFSEPKMAKEAIDDLHSCFEHLKAKSKSNKRNSSVNDSEPEWVEVVVELLLSLLSRKSHLLRSLVGCVFRHICPYLTSGAIHNILLKLDPNRNPLTDKYDDEDSDSKPESSGEDEEGSDEDDDNDDDDEDEEENDGNGDEEKVSDAEDNNSEETEEAIEEESDSDIEDSEAEDEKVTDLLRMRVQRALGAATLQTDDEDVDVDKIDEEEGKALDRNLAEAFKILRGTRKSRSKKQDENAQVLTHFRIRVIDLLEIYLEAGPSMALALDMLVPLFVLLEFCIKDPHQKPLENRVRACLKKLAAIKKFENLEGVDEEVLITVLKVLIEKGERSASVCQIMGDKLAEGCVFLIRCSQQTNIPTDAFIQIFEENLTSFFEKRNCILPAALFKRLLQLSWIGIWRLAPLLVNFAFAENIRSYRRGQALEFLKVFYNNGKMINSEEHRNTRLKMEKKLCKESIKLLQVSSQCHENGESTTDAQEIENGKSATNMGKEIKQKYISHLLSLLFAVNIHHMPEAWNWEEIGNKMAAYRSTISLAKDAKTAYNKLAQRIGAPVVTKKIQNVNKTKLCNGNHDSESEQDAADDTHDNNQSDACNKLSTKKDKKRKKKKNKEQQKVELSSVNMSNGTIDEPMQNGDSSEEKKVEKIKNKRPSPNTPDVPNKKKKKAAVQGGD